MHLEVREEGNCNAPYISEVETDSIEFLAEEPSMEHILLKEEYTYMAFCWEVHPDESARFQ